MLSVREVFAEFEAHPNFHEGFVIGTRINFFQLTQKEVALAAGLQPASLTNIIKGHVKAKRETVDNINDAITKLTRRQ